MFARNIRKKEHIKISVLCQSALSCTIFVTNHHHHSDKCLISKQYIKRYDNNMPVFYFSATLHKLVESVFDSGIFGPIRLKVFIPTIKTGNTIASRLILRMPMGSGKCLPSDEPMLLCLSCYVAFHVAI